MNIAFLLLTMFFKVNQEFQKNIQGTGPRSIEIKSVSSLDDGWYQCHVGVYVNTSIVEKIGYIYLNILGKYNIILLHNLFCIILLHHISSSNVELK